MIDRFILRPLLYARAKPRSHTVLVCRPNALHHRCANGKQKPLVLAARRMQLLAPYYHLVGYFQEQAAMEVWIMIYLEGIIPNRLTPAVVVWH